jgi:uncharacterized membrane protein
MTAGRVPDRSAPPRFHDRPILAAPSPLPLVTGAAAHAASLTPSLIPRDGLLQGAVAGVSFAVVYGLAAMAVALWVWLGLPATRRVWPRRLFPLVALGILGWGLSMATPWQNAVNRAVGLAPVESVRPLVIAGVSLAVALLLVLLGRLVRRLSTVAANVLVRLLPPRVALLGGGLAAAALVWALATGVLLDAGLRAADRIYRGIDALLPPDAAAPADPAASGGPGSLLDWAGLGAEGRNRVDAAPDAAAIAAVTGRPAQQPLRVYVGLNSADTAAERAALALAELIRIGAFDRQVLVIATPTGTGWIDPASMAPVEMLWGGDIASVSVQYSYLPSWLSLFVEPDYGRETAEAVFRAVYGHWHGLPRDARPRLYLHGLSLGSLNSDLSAPPWLVLGDPPQGAFWVGPPFASQSWPAFVAARNPGTSAWAPELGDGALVRFTTQENRTGRATAPWGAMRIVYLQYASDPIVFFDVATLWRAPAWLAPPRGPDVAPELRWVPVVTFLQLVTDMMTATTTPAGTGHVYAARHYLDGWLAVTDPPGWDAAALDRLRGWLSAQGL